MRNSTFFAIAVALTLCPAIAQAEDDTARAEQLFQEGRKLVDAGNFKEACPKFQASQDAAPAIGTLLNLADCYERAGLFATAQKRFQDAQAAAQKAGRPDREKTAKDRAAALDARISRITVSAQESGVEVTLDEKALTDLGRPTPVDPGRHHLQATAPGKRAWEKVVEVGASPEQIRLEVPTLAPVESADEKLKGPAASTSDGSTQRTLGIVAMAVGGVGIGVGAFFGIQTFSKWSDAEKKCPGNQCVDPSGKADADDAKSSGTISTIAMGAGAAFAIGGAVLFFTAPKSATTAGRSRLIPSVGSNAAGISWMGAF